MSALELPNFRTTEEAIAYGQFMTPDQYRLLQGAHQALLREFALLDAMKDHRIVIQLQCDMACRIQLYREAMEVAPDRTLAATIDDIKPEDWSVLDHFIPARQPLPIPPAGFIQDCGPNGESEQVA